LHDGKSAITPKEAPSDARRWQAKGLSHHRWSLAAAADGDSSCSALSQGDRVLEWGAWVQPLAGAFQEHQHKILEIRWREPDPNDRSKPAEHIEGINAATERGSAREMAGTLEKLGESGVEE
jgi:hypothetical protein